MATDVRKLGLGAAVLLVSSTVIVATGTMGAPVPNLLAAVAGDRSLDSHLGHVVPRDDAPCDVPADPEADDHGRDDQQDAQ